MPAGLRRVAEGLLMVVLGALATYYDGCVMQVILWSLAGLCLVVLAIDLLLGRRIRRRPISPPPPPQPQSPPDPASDSAGYSPALVKASGTNDGQFPRVESAVDSLGHAAKRALNDQFYAMTEHVLRPGQQVTFELEVSDPNGEDVELSVITPAGREADVTINEGVITWNVREEDVGDPANVHIYVASRRNYRRYSKWDDAASFVYRVLPRV